MAKRNVAGFDDIPQGLIWYASCAGFVIVVLFGLQAAIVGMTHTDVAYLSVGVGLWVVFGAVYHVRKRRLRRDPAPPI